LPAETTLHTDQARKDRTGKDHARRFAHATISKITQANLVYSQLFVLCFFFVMSLVVLVPLPYMHRRRHQLNKKQAFLSNGRDVDIGVLPFDPAQKTMTNYFSGPSSAL